MVGLNMDPRLRGDDRSHGTTPLACPGETCWIGANRAVRVRLFLELVEVLLPLQECLPVSRFGAMSYRRAPRPAACVMHVINVAFIAPSACGRKKVPDDLQRIAERRVCPIGSAGLLAEGAAEGRNPPVYDGYAGLRPRCAVGRQHTVHPVTIVSQHELSRVPKAAPRLHGRHSRR